MRPVHAIQIAGRLIGHQDRRLHHERARQRDALLLASGKLYRIMIHAVLQARRSSAVPLPAPSPPHVAPRQFMRQQDILFRRQRRDQLIGLKHEPDLLAPHHRQLVFAQSGDIGAVDDTVSRRRRIQPGQQPQQVLFPLPEAPMIATNCPAGTSKSTPRRMSTRCVPVSMVLVSACVARIVIYNHFSDSEGHISHGRDRVPVDKRRKAIPEGFVKRP